MTRKHFIAIAAILNGDRATAANEGEVNKVRVIALSLSDYFYSQNPNFDRQRFLTACGF